jgi:quercetin dioxygenase-like cupin family protein
MNLTTMTATTQEQEAERKVLLENAEVVVIETTYPPNTGVAMHEHRYQHVVYVVNGGTVQTSSPDGSVSTLELHSGQTLWRNPQSHSTRNIGSTTYKVLEIEIKSAAR